MPKRRPPLRKAQIPRRAQVPGRAQVGDIAVYRAGERVAGEIQPSENPAVLGWWSPTYGYKEPALTLVATLEGELPLRLTSWWRLGDVDPKDFSLEWGSLQEDPLLAFLSKE